MSSSQAHLTSDMVVNVSDMMLLGLGNCPEVILFSFEGARSGWCDKKLGFVDFMSGINFT